MAILLITHDPNVASFADSIYEMENGTLALRQSRGSVIRRDPQTERGRGPIKKTRTATTSIARMIDHNSQGRHFLFIAHPGHELCVYAWLKLTKPKVFVLTDG